MSLHSDKASLEGRILEEFTERRILEYPKEEHRGNILILLFTTQEMNSKGFLNHFKPLGIKKDDR